jgi:hypothetical protein
MTMRRNLPKMDISSRHHRFDMQKTDIERTVWFPIDKKGWNGFGHRNAGKSASDFAILCMERGERKH